MWILNNGLLKGQCAMSADETKGKPVKMSWDSIFYLMVMLSNCLMNIYVSVCRPELLSTLVRKDVFLQWAEVNEESRGTNVRVTKIRD